MHAKQLASEVLKMFKKINELGLLMTYLMLQSVNFLIRVVITVVRAEKAVRLPWEKLFTLCQLRYLLKSLYEGKESCISHQIISGQWFSLDLELSCSQSTVCLRRLHRLVYNCNE